MEAVHDQAPENAVTGWAALNTKWENRTRIAAAWLQTATAVADIGCGMMTLESFLPKSTRYIPLDIVPRDDRTIVFDLNTQTIPTLPCDTAALLGVLEYVDDLGATLPQLRQFSRCLITYNHIAINDLLWRLRLRPKRVTWRNRHSQSAFRNLIGSAGLQITRERRIRYGETLYEIQASLPPAQQ